MVWVPCVKAWSIDSHCWEVLWPAGGTAPGKAAGTVGLNSSYSSLLLALTWLGTWVALLYHTFPQHATVLQQGQGVLGWKFQYYASKSTFLFIYWFLWRYYYSYRELTQTHSKAHRIGLLSCSTTLLICPSPSAPQSCRLCGKVLVTSVGRQSLWRTPAPVLLSACRDTVCRLPLAVPHSHPDKMTIISHLFIPTAPPKFSESLVTGVITMVS